MEEGGKFDKANTSQPVFYGKESKDNTQVVYIYSTSSEIKHEAADHDSFDEHRSECGPLHTSNSHRKEPRTFNEPEDINWRQEHDVDTPGAEGSDAEAEHERYAPRRSQFQEQRRNWAPEESTSQRNSPHIFRSQNVLDGIYKAKHINRRQIVHRSHSENSDYSSKNRQFMIREMGSGDRAMYMEGGHHREMLHERRRTDDHLPEDNDKNGRFKVEYGDPKCDENIRAGRKAFTPIRIYPSTKDYYRERPRPYKKHEYNSVDPPPNVTLVSQDQHNYTLYDDKERDEQRYEEESRNKKPENGNIESARSFRNYRSEERYGSSEGLSKVQRRDPEDYQENEFDGKMTTERYEAGRMRDEVDHEKAYQFDKEISRKKAVKKERDELSPEDVERRYIRPVDDAMRRLSPNGYARLPARERSRYECETPMYKDSPYRVNECYGGHDHNMPRKCERYSEMLHDMEINNSRMKTSEERPGMVYPGDSDGKRIVGPNGYLMPECFFEGTLYQEVDIKMQFKKKKENRGKIEKVNLLHKIFRKVRPKYKSLYVLQLNKMLRNASMWSNFAVTAYQRCCCPCCPCYSVFRQSARDRSPASPQRCHPQKQPISPAPVSRPPPNVPRDQDKGRQAPMVQQMPAELQLKMVARGLPHLRRRRNRTVYTHDQIEELEEVFKIKHYLDVDEKGSIAKRLGIRTENVEIWFKNRRAKWRKEMKTVKSNSDGEITHYMDEDESNTAEDHENFVRKSFSSILSKDIPEERPTMTLYHTGQERIESQVDSSVMEAVEN